MKDYTILAKNGKNIVLCWIPSHVGILGNEQADAAAKLVLSLSVTPMKLTATDIECSLLLPSDAGIAVESSIISLCKFLYNKSCYLSSSYGC